MIRQRQIFHYDNVQVECLGDPHLGKRFNAGVPLHRKGEREKMVWADFQESLTQTKAQLHVCMGDLFDNFIVEPRVMLRAADIYIRAAEANPATHFVVLQGNHDMSRDTEKVSSFRIFKELVDGVNNIMVVDEAKSLFFPKDEWSFAFFPYLPFKTSEEVIKEFLDNSPIKRFDAVFGHWDLDSFGEMPHNIFPSQLVASITNDAYTGHIHLPEERSYGGVPELILSVIGSMQPYNHSEDPERKLYTTLTMDMLRNTDPATLKNMCVRLVLAPNEEAPEGLDCLQYTTKKMDALEDDEDLTVELEDFDFRTIINNEMTQQGVTEMEVINFINTEFDRLRAEEAA